MPERISKITGKPVQKRKYTKPTGRPTKITPEIRRQAIIAAEKGFTDAEMAQLFDITEQTFNNWKIAYPKFFETLKKAKQLPDADVVQALFDRAKGYRCVDGDGKFKQYPPDPVSCIFWLKNRDKERWRDKQDLQIGLDESMLQTVLAGMDPERAESVKKELIALALKKKKS